MIRTFLYGLIYPKSFLDQVLLLLVFSLMLVNLVLMRAYSPRTDEEAQTSRLHWRHAKRQLFFVPPILLLFGARWVLTLTSGRFSFSSTIIMMVLGFLAACFQFFFIGFGRTLLGCTVWLSGIAGVVLDFDRFSDIKETLSKFENAVYQDPEAKLFALRYVIEEVHFWMDRFVLPLFLTGTTLVVIGAAIFMRDYSANQQRIIALSVGITWITVTIFILLWLLAPLDGLLDEIKRMLLP